MTTLENIEGTLAQIRFHKDGFLIGRLSEGPSIKGYITTPQIGLRYKLEGRWDHNPRWGDTFVFSSYRQSYPKSLPAIQAYLQEHAPWVGPEISQRITAAYGEDSLEILKSDPSRAAKEINGITEDRALEISAMLKGMEEGEALELAVCDVVGNEISPRLRRKVVELWGQEAPNRIRENPYALIEALDGVGFLTADRIALKVGFDREGAPRIRAGISHALKEACWNQGHTYLPKHMLVLKAKGVLGINPEKIDAVIIQMAQEELLILRYEAAYLPDLYKDETIVAEELRRILKGKQKTDTTMVS